METKTAGEIEEKRKQLRLLVGDSYRYAAVAGARRSRSHWCLCPMHAMSLTLCLCCASQRPHLQRRHHPADVQLLQQRGGQPQADAGDLQTGVMFKRVCYFVCMSGSDKANPSCLSCDRSETRWCSVGQCMPIGAALTMVHTSQFPRARNTLQCSLIVSLCLPTCRPGLRTSSGPYPPPRRAPQTALAGVPGGRHCMVRILLLFILGALGNPFCPFDTAWHEGLAAGCAACAWEKPCGASRNQVVDHGNAWYGVP